MPRSFAFLLILLAVLIGALFFFSSRAEEVPTTTIEIDTSRVSDAS